MKIVPLHLGFGTVLLVTEEEITKRRKYVWAENNGCKRPDIISVGSNVVVLNTQNMCDEYGNKAQPHEFIENNRHELFKVVATNVAVPTFIAPIRKNIVGITNNTVIEAYDGRRYYCSIVNILRFEKLK